MSCHGVMHQLIASHASPKIHPEPVTLPRVIETGHFEASALRFNEASSFLSYHQKPFPKPSYEWMKWIDRADPLSIRLSVRVILLRMDGTKGMSKGKYDNWELTCQGEISNDDITRLSECSCSDVEVNAARAQDVTVSEMSCVQASLRFVCILECIASSQPGRSAALRKRQFKAPKRKRGKFWLK